jgi:hypothetical protein
MAIAFSIPAILASLITTARRFAPDEAARPDRPTTNLPSNDPDIRKKI